MNNERKTKKVLKAALTLNNYLNNEESYCSDILWVDSKGYALHTDIGYFFEGLGGVIDLLTKRCEGAIPEFPMACVKYKGRNGKK